MPKNKKGGNNKHKKNEPVKRELILKTNDPSAGIQEYGIVIKKLGGSRMEVKCLDAKTRICKIRGSMQMKAWVDIGDVVLIGLRDFQDNIGDIVLKYSPDEVREIKKQGHLIDFGNYEPSASVESKDDDIPFDFDTI
jgi:translation initiation factor 1A